MKKLNPSEIIQELFLFQKEILKNINQESVNVYLWLKGEYEKRNIKNNYIFQFVFRSYYRLDNAGLSNTQKEKFFDLMTNKQINLETILRTLYYIPTLRSKKSIQFSFATKLLHTIDNSKPIFDKEVSFVIHRTVAWGNMEERIESAKRIYADIEVFYLRLVENEKIKKIIKNFKTKFKIDEKRITDQKILDFLIWSLGKLKKKK